MVKNNNNKVNNIINIVNDLKGLGLLNRRRKRRSQRDPQQGKVIYKPQRISGIEKTIIDNSPQLRRDVEQLSNERSVLGGKLMENESRLKFIQDQIEQNPLRFITQTPIKNEQRSLSDVQGNSLYLPSINQLYNNYVE